MMIGNKDLHKTGVNVGFFASHHGSAFRSILERKRTKFFEIMPRVLITNNRHAPCLSVAQAFGVPAFVLNQVSVGEQDLDAEICSCLLKSGADFVILAGFMKKTWPQ